MALIKKEYEYSEGVVSGEVLAKEIELPKKSTIHFSTHGFICSCGGLMADEPARQGKVKVFCVNVNCSENLVTKEITLPSITDYVLCSDCS